MPSHIAFEGRPVEVDILKRRPSLEVAVEGHDHVVADICGSNTGPFEMRLDGRVYRGWRYVTADEVYVWFDGRTAVVGLPQAAGSAAGGGLNDDDIRADMPGTVVAVHCADGDDVTSGEKIVTIESMKLQIVLVAPRDGKIAKVSAIPNMTFERGAVLVTLAPRKE